MFPSRLRNRELEYDAVVDTVVDGDTIDVVLLTPGYPTVAIRLTYVRSPEEGEVGYQETKDYLNSLISHGSPVRIFNRDTWTFDRLLGTVYDKDWRDINHMVIQFVESNGYPLGRAVE